MDEQKWPDEWLKGVLPFAVLSVLAGGSLHGYRLGIELQSRNVGRFQGGTLYPLLQRLTDQGLIRAEWEHPASGPARKVFSLTEQGTERYYNLVRQWEQFDRIVKGLQIQ